MNEQENEPQPTVEPAVTEPITTDPPPPVATATGGPAPGPKPKKQKRESLATRFQNAAQAVIDACDAAEENLGSYVDDVNDAITALTDAIAALEAQLQEQVSLVESDLEDLREIRSEYEAKYDDMGERAREGEKGQTLSAICDIDLSPSMPEVECEAPGECEAVSFDYVRDCAQECLDAELP